MKCFRLCFERDSLFDRCREELHTCQPHKPLESSRWLWLCRCNLAAQFPAYTDLAAVLQGRGSLKEVSRLEQNILQKGKRWS